MYVEVERVVEQGHLLLTEDPRQCLPFRVNPGRQLERQCCRRRISARHQFCEQSRSSVRIAPQYRDREVDHVRPGIGHDATYPGHVTIEAAQAVSRVRQRNDPA